jgi:hypothetical protein
LTAASTALILLVTKKKTQLLFFLRLLITVSMVVVSIRELGLSVILRSRQNSSISSNSTTVS